MLTGFCSSNFNKQIIINKQIMMRIIYERKQSKNQVSLMQLANLYFKYFSRFAKQISSYFFKVLPKGKCLKLIVSCPSHCQTKYNYRILRTKEFQFHDLLIWYLIYVIMYQNLIDQLYFQKYQLKVRIFFDCMKCSMIDYQNQRN